MLKSYIENYAKTSILVAVLMIIVAICVICHPLDSMEIMICIFGFVLAVCGIASILSYFRKKVIERLNSFDLLIGVGLLISAILIFIYRSVLIEYLTVIIGIWIIISSLFGLQIAINLFFAHFSRWQVLAILSLIELIIGLIQINDPALSVISSVTLAGILLLINEICTLVNSIILIKTMKSIENGELFQVK